jgi:hypothetical protein
MTLRAGGRVTSSNPRTDWSFPLKQGTSRSKRKIITMLDRTHIKAPPPLVNDNGECQRRTTLFVAAQLYIDGVTPTLARAAAVCGSSIPSVRSAVVITLSEDHVLKEQVLQGQIGILAAARLVEKIAAVVSAFRDAAPADLALAGEIIGVGVVWDNMISPTV